MRVFIALSGVGALLSAGGLLAALVACGARTELDQGTSAPATRDVGPAGTSCPGDACAPPPSCASPGQGRSDCGSSAAESCCNSPAVSGGTFDRTYENTAIGYGVSNETQPASVSAFRLDEFLVTVGRFRGFVAAWRAGWLPPAGSGKHAHLNGGRGLADLGGGFEPGWVPDDDAFVAPTTANLSCRNGPYVQPSGTGTWTDAPGPNEDLPIDCVTWAEAFAFCIWDGGFLPSDAEWNYVAAGGAEDRMYPWGSMDPGTSSAYAIFGCYYPGGNSPCTVAPVGWARRGASRWGQLDITGNVMEWIQDWVAMSNSPLPGTCVDCFVGSAAPRDVLRVKRGAHWASETSALGANVAWEDNPTTRSVINGIRCARTP